MKDSTILVTGGSGFIGSRLCSAISETDSHLRMLVRRPVEGVNARQFVVDFEQNIIPEEAFKGVDTIFHLAGFTHDLREISETEHLYHAINVDATLHLAQLAVKNGVKQFVFVSSTKAGGCAKQGLRMNETDQSEPEGIYGQTKRTAELKLLEISAQSNMRVSIIRPSLVYGEGVKGNLSAMLRAIDNGWFPPIPETHNRRSMIHVDDLVNILLLASKDKRASGEIFIATDGHDYSTRKIYEAICKAAGRKVPCWRLPDILFKLASKAGDLLKGRVPFPFDSYKYQKLLGDECFSSKKLQTLLEFKSKYTLYDALSGMVFALREEKR